jgi:hypothetical protein
VKDRLARAFSPRAILLVSWVIGIAYAYPGYLNYDSADQLYQVRIHRYTDWHPPLMQGYWRLVEIVVHGPFGLLVLQTALWLWGLYELFQHRWSRRRAAVTAALVFLFPPLFCPMAVVWKDAQMMAFLLAGVMLALRPKLAARIAGLVLLFLAAGVRDNAATALPPLCLLVVATWLPGRGRVVRTAVAAGICLALIVSAMLCNRALTDRREHSWSRSTAIFDIAGTICHAGPMSDDELRDLLAGTALQPTHDLQAAFCKVYSPRVYFPVSNGPDRVFADTTKASELAKRRRVWWTLVREHPRAFVEHRWAVTREVLGLTAEPLWEPVCQTFAANRGQRHRIHFDETYSWLQRKLGHAYGWLATTPIFRPWVYFVVSLVFLGYAVARRDVLVMALVGSGLLYELSFFLATSAPDFRYSAWMIACTCAGGILIALERAGVRPPQNRGQNASAAKQREASHATST